MYDREIFKDFIEGNNKDAFSLWLEKQPQRTNSSKVYSESSRSAFIRALEKGLTKSAGLDEYAANFFLVNDIDEVNKRKEKYKAGILLYDKNNDNTDFKNAIEIYLKFLNEKNVDKFTWIPFYTSFADELLRFKEDRRSLISIIKAVYANTGIKLPKLDYDEIIDVDPFTVFALFNKGIKDENRIKIINAFKKYLNISADTPTDFLGVPVVNNLSATYYYFEGKRGPRDIDNLWDLFEMALLYSKTGSDGDKENLINLFDIVTKQKGVSWNITMGLFWIRPYSFINLDCCNRNAFFELRMIPQIDYQISDLIKQYPSGRDYFRIIDLCNEAFDIEEDLCFPVLSCRAWDNKVAEARKPKVTNIDSSLFEEGWWPSLDEYDPDVSTDEWIDFLKKDSEKHPSTLKMLATMLELGGEATCKKLSEVLGGHHTTYISRATGLGERVKKEFSLPPCMDSDKERLFPVAFLGRRVDGTQLYAWKLRPELKEALEEMDLSFLEDISMKTNINKNTILYGPPGTGKTYITARYAVAIIENKPLSALEDLSYDEIIDKYNDYKEQGRIEFITFHQSYGYEEFIEGIKPVIENSPDDNNEIRYDVVDGIFKKFCNLAIEKHYTFVENPVVTPNSIKTGKRKTIPIRRNLNYVFIIDEINRGNISKIFGELITLIEDSKRIENFFRSDEVEYKVKLPYSQKLFGVPDNVYIIGTMNTADRSIAAIDTALRRRFAFEEMMPDSSVVEGIEVDGVSVSKLLDLINKRIEVLYDREHTIGHAYFTPLLKEKKADILFDIFRNKIFPLLQEYFYEDYEKIRLVLGDNQKSDDKLQFINEETVDYGELFGSNVYDYDDKKVYKINEAAFENIEAYKEILKGRS